ncbi:integrase-like [Tenebrio molitor]|uniref:integrase-like n=1 Tax=Tenebrio molitor TaxID=7067 RepID=UPI00362487B7
MASLSRRTRSDGSHSWRVEGRDSTGATTSLTFATEHEALDHMRVVDRLGWDAARTYLERIEGHHTDAPTLSEALTDYVRRAHDITDGTKDDYRRILDRSGLTSRLGSLPIDLITEDDVHDWIGHRRNTQSARTGGPISAKTIRNEHALLSTLIEHAVRRGWTQHNPAKGVRLPEMRRAEMLVLTNEQYAAIHAAMDPAYQPFLEFLAVTGTRWGEATALQWGDINARTSPPRVTINRAWKKGKAGAWAVEGFPKTSAGNRSFTVPQRLVERLGTPGKRTDLVFQGATGRPIQHTNFHARKWVKACEDAGVLDPRPRVHDLRHYMASTLLSAGVPMHAISRRLGHESITTTVGTYGHLTPDMQAAGLDTMDSVLALTPTRPEVTT